MSPMVNSGDLLIVDRSVKPRNDFIVIAVISGELTVKQFRREGKRILLVPANAKYPRIEPNPDQEFELWGVVTFVVRDTCTRL